MVLPVFVIATATDTCLPGSNVVTVLLDAQPCLLVKARNRDGMIESLLGL